MTRKPTGPSERDLRILSAWWRTGSISGAAKDRGLQPQTVKNVLAQMRDRANAPVTERLMALYWRDIAALGEVAGSYRKVRYHLDPDYRERQKATSRVVMRQRRAAEVGERQQEFDRLYAEQGGVCAICGRDGHILSQFGKPLRLALDHDHLTGANRGLLCRSCNVMLGNAGDQPVLLEKGADYLRLHARTAQHNNRGAAA